MPSINITVEKGTENKHARIVVTFIDVPKHWRKFQEEIMHEGISIITDGTACFYGPDTFYTCGSNASVINDTASMNLDEFYMERINPHGLEQNEAIEIYFNKLKHAIKLWREYQDDNQ